MRNREIHIVITDSCDGHKKSVDVRLNELQMMNMAKITKLNPIEFAINRLHDELDVLIDQQNTKP